MRFLKHHAFGADDGESLPLMKGISAGRCFTAVHKSGITTGEIRFHFRIMKR
jgi:hypothetical protein